MKQLATLFLLVLLTTASFAQKNITELKNGIWIHEKDSLAGIEIINQKWIMFYEGKKTDSSDIYNYKIVNELPQFADTELTPGEFLILTNRNDTMYFEILAYNNNNSKIMSLLHFPTCKIHVYKSE